jgi:methyl-accepting chemotaxis protein
MQWFFDLFRRARMVMRFLIALTICLSPLAVGLPWALFRLSDAIAVARSVNPTALALEQHLVAVQSLLIWSSVGTVVCGLILVVGLAGSIIQPLALLKKVTGQLAGGDLTITVDTHWSDEVGDITRQVASLRDSLVQLMNEVHESTDCVSVASGQLAQGNADLSRRTEESAAHLQQTAGSMEEIRVMARQSSDSANRMSQLSAQVASMAERGEAALSKGVVTVGSLSVSSRKMAEIISVIDSIAFQTNILALNAAVEAARAGEQGRGFAVVASEVRALAQRSATSAKEIKTLIEATITGAEESAHAVKQAGSEMQLVMDGVRSVNEQLAQIEKSAVEQSAGIDSVGRSVSELDTATQRNAALVEEASAAADQLKDQAHRLNDALAKFQLPTG